MTATPPEGDAGRPIRVREAHRPRGGFAAQIDGSTLIVDRALKVNARARRFTQL